VLIKLNKTVLPAQLRWGNKLMRLLLIVMGACSAMKHARFY